MMQRPQYDAQGPVSQYNRPPYNNGGYGMGRPMDAMQQQGYNQPPMNYYQQPQGYPMGNPMYNMPQGYPPAMQGYRGGRGRGGWYYPNGSRGGYGPMRGGFRGGRGGFPVRRKKPFVGGSLETQREFEHQTACCFHLQGSCKFGEGCRFLHDDVEGRPCQFGDKCRVHGTAKESEAAAPAKEAAAKKDDKAPDAKPTAEKPAAEKPAEKPAAEKATEKPAEKAAAAEKPAEKPAAEQSKEAEKKE